MSVRSGHQKSRNPMKEYRGFTIIQVTEIDYHRSIWNPEYFDKNWIDHKEVYYDFCKEGEEKRPSQDYQVGAKNVAECKEAIDKFLEDDSLYFTAEEREKYVCKPNRKNNWAYGYKDLMKMLKEHQKATKRMKILIEDRLEDANFHAECGFLAYGDYDGFIEFVRKNYTFMEKFEVYTATECKRIKNPQTLVEGMNKAIADYLASQGIKDTSVNVRFIENW